MATFRSGKDFEKAIRQAAQPEIDRIAKKKTTEFKARLAAVERTHAGRSESEVLAELKRVVRSTPGGNADPKWLATRAKEIAAKRRAS